MEQGDAEMTLAEHRKARRAATAAMRARFVADLGDYYAQSAATEIVNAFRSGNYVEVKA